jgi:hypothetical protein
MAHRLAPIASATGTGPTIALGTAVSGTVPVNASTTAPDAYRGFHLHVAVTPSAGVTVNTITGSATGSTLDTGGLFCNTQVPAPNEVNYGCVALDGQSSTAAGLLATMTLGVTGNGCITVRLIDLPAGDPNAVVSDTYTVDHLTSTLQQNTVSTTTAKVLVGTGTLAQCAGSGAVGGVATAPDVAALGSRSARRSPLVPAGVALTVLLALVAAIGLRRRFTEPR